MDDNSGGWLYRLASCLGLLIIILLYPLILVAYIILTWPELWDALTKEGGKWRPYK